MARLLVSWFSLSLDGCGAGPRQSREDPLGVGGEALHDWIVTDGIEAALERARAAAGEKDIRLGGGVSTIRQYLQARLVDQMHLAVEPMLLGAGEPLLLGLDLPPLGYKCTESVAGERAVHYMIGRA